MLLKKNKNNIKLISLKRYFFLKISNINKKYIGQRIDNFLFHFLKKINKNYIYKILRLGKIRINKKRIKHYYKLLKNDILKIPLIKHENKNIKNILNIKLDILYEDKYLLIINKKTGIAVHSGSGINFGLIENIKNNKNNKNNFYELIHRIDKDTSGILLIAKKYSCLRFFHEQIRNKIIKKYYLVLVYGIWKNIFNKIKLYLGKKKKNNENYICIKKNGKFSYTKFVLINKYKNFSLLEAQLKTGYTHQIRVHLSSIGFPIVGDKKYGNFVLNNYLKKNIENLIFKKMFLHSYKMNFIHPKNKENFLLISKLPKKYLNFLKKL